MDWTGRKCASETSGLLYALPNESTDSDSLREGCQIFGKALRLALSGAYGTNDGSLPTSFGPANLQMKTLYAIGGVSLWQSTGRQVATQMFEKR